MELKSNQFAVGPFTVTKLSLLSSPHTEYRISFRGVDIGGQISYPSVDDCVQLSRSAKMIAGIRRAMHSAVVKGNRK